MLRLLLFLFYLFTSSSTSPHTRSGRAEIGGGLDPNGLRAQSPPATIDSGGGWDPNGSH